MPLFGMIPVVTLFVKGAGAVLLPTALTAASLLLVFSWPLLPYVRLMASAVRPSVVCLSVVCNVCAPYLAGWTLGNIFAAPNSLGTLAVVLKFWTESQRSTRWWCNLNGRGYKKIGVFWPISRFISSTVQHTTIVAVEDD